MRLLDSVYVENWRKGHLIAIACPRKESHFGHQYEFRQVESVFIDDERIGLLGQPCEKQGGRNPKVDHLSNLKRLNSLTKFRIAFIRLFQQCIGLRGVEQPVSVELGITPARPFDQFAEPVLRVFRFQWFFHRTSWRSFTSP